MSSTLGDARGIAIRDAIDAYTAGIALDSDGVMIGGLDRDEIMKAIGNAITDTDPMRDHPFYPPREPNATFDDEFGGTVLSGWTKDYTRTQAPDPYASFASGNTRDEVRDGSFRIQPPTNGVLSRIHKAVTVPTNLFLWAKLGFSYVDPTVATTSNGDGWALQLGATSGGAPSTTDVVTLYLLESDAGVIGVQFIVTEGGSTTHNEAMGDIDTLGTGQPIQYVAIHKVGSNIHGMVSPNGRNWTYLGVENYTGATLDRISLRATNASVGNPGNRIYTADFIRGVESATFRP